MTKKSIYFGTLLLTALALGSCASDDTATDKIAGKDTPKTGTVFSSEDEPSTRTSATYTGSGLDFYWTANDKIWVKDDNNTYHQSSEDDIASRIAAVPGSTTTAKAKFWVNGTYTGSTHKVRYTGKNGASDKVIIKASQTQSTPNDAAHIAEDGDFGVADATGSGKYSFTLNHKAAYVTFMPFSTQSVITTAAKLQKIRIYTSNTSDQLAGKFDLADNGTLSNGTATSNSVELNVSNFSIPSVSTYATNGATMVVKPGTYTNLTIEYTLHDAVTNVTGVIEKTYPSVTFDAGKNTPVKADLKVKIYPANDYFEWDAQQHYWAGFEWDNPIPAKRTQPTLNLQQNKTDAPQSTISVSAHTSRDFNDIAGYNDPTGVAPAVKASHSAVNAPNANEMLWYGEKGNPHWDSKTLWATMGHLYTGGIWFKKQSTIVHDEHKTLQELKEKAPDGTDYTKNNYTSGHMNYNVTQGKPTNINDYFYLPARGVYDLPSNDGIFYIGGAYPDGNYWTCTPAYWGTTSAIGLAFTDQFTYIQNFNRGSGYNLFSSSNENEYYPLF